MLTPFATPSVLLTLAVALQLLSPTNVQAAAGPQSGSLGSIETETKWHVFETANFRIFSHGTTPDIRQIADASERQRDHLSGQWLAEGELLDWHPKCDVVLHASDASYRQAVGGGEATVASSLVDRQDGQISVRRIDVRATRPDWQTEAFGHELAHLVLADRFGKLALPRWVDEGVAILADSHTKRRAHRRTVQRAVARGSEFRLAEMMALADYPPTDRWGTFYSQSASLVEYLVAQQGHVRFAEFIDLAAAHGYQEALRRIYHLGVEELEHDWHRSVSG